MCIHCEEIDKNDPWEPLKENARTMCQDDILNMMRQAKKDQAPMKPIEPKTKEC
jgi:hypothetical protein